MGIFAGWKPDSTHKRAMVAEAPPKPSAREALASAAKVLALKPSVDKQELQRILSLPVIEPMDEQELEEFNRYVVKAVPFKRGFRLFQPQAEGILGYQKYGGLFAGVGVGFGKSLLTKMIASHAIKKGKKKILLLIPPQVFGQFWDRDIAWGRRHVALDNLEFYALGRKSPKARAKIAARGGTGCYVMPFSGLSAKDASDLLDAIQPDVTIVDEAHNLRHRTAARTKRWMRMVETYKPEVCILTGTMTAKSILDYWHLIRHALKQNCPLPIPASLAYEWAGLLDAGVESPTGTAAIEPLVRWAEQRWPEQEFSVGVEGFRKAFKQRLIHAPGVVMSGDNDIGVSLVLENQEIPLEGEGSEHLKELIKQVEKPLMLTPSGDRIDHAIHKFKWQYELSAGFYNDLFWPDEDTFAERKKISRERAIDVLERAKEYHAKGQDYAKALREFLDEFAAPGADTPFLVGGMMHTHGREWVRLALPTFARKRGFAEAGAYLYSLWSIMKDADFEGRPERDSVPRRVCDYKVRAAVAWAKEHPEGLIWVHHQELGEWIVEDLKAAGLGVLHCPAGETANAHLIDPVMCRGKVAVASISAHGTGKNLQHFGDQLVVQFPRSATVAEQMLGRTHRNGQERPSLTASTLNSNAFDHQVMAACLNDSVYIQATTGNRQKLMMCSWNPWPKTFPSDVLVRYGLQPKILTGEMEQMRKDKFEPEAQ